MRDLLLKMVLLAFLLTLGAGCGEGGPKVEVPDKPAPRPTETKQKTSS